VDLRAGDADVAIRYARKMPTDLVAQEIFRDTFFPICTPALVEKYAQPIQRAVGVLRYPLIHFDWTNRDPQAPTWVRRITTARSVGS
jgi:LysR family glycine cleavage system transcriptional activator